MQRGRDEGSHYGEKAQLECELMPQLPWFLLDNVSTQFNDVITHVCVLSVRPSTHPSLSVTLACYTFNKPIHN